MNDSKTEAAVGARVQTTDRWSERYGIQRLVGTVADSHGRTPPRKDRTTFVDLDEPHMGMRRLWFNPSDLESGA